MALYTQSQIAAALNTPYIDPGIIFDNLAGVAQVDGETYLVFNNLEYVAGETPAFYREVALDVYEGVTPSASELLVPQAVVDSQTGVVTGTTAVQMPAATTPVGNVKAGALAGRVPIGSLIAGVAIGAGVGLKEVAQHPTFWNDLSEAVFNDLKSPDAYIAKPFAFNETKDIIWRMLSDGSIQAYCDKRSIDKVIQRLYEFNVINSGRVEPGIDHPGQQTVTYGAVDVQVVTTAAAVTGSLISAQAITAAYNGAIAGAGTSPYNAISANAAPGRVSVSLYNMPESILIQGQGTAQSPYYVDHPQQYGITCCVCSYDVQTGDITDIRYETPSSLCYTEPFVNQAGTGFCSNVGATVIPANPAVIPNPEAIPAPDDENEFWTTFSDWLNNKITVPFYNPQTNQVDDKIYLPFMVPDINWQTDPITAPQTQPWEGIYPFPDPFADPTAVPVANPEPWVFPSIGKWPDPAPTTPDPTPWDNNPKFPQPTPTPTGNTPTIAGPTSGVGSSNKLYTVYNPTQAQVDALGAYLWTQNIVELIAQFFQNPLEAIISLHLVYCTPSTGSAKNIILGYLDSGVSANVVTSQYVDIACGYVDIPEFYGNALDYTGVAVQIFLPFIGYRVLKTKEVMGRRLEVDYKVDVYTGTCLAFLYVISANTRQLLYTFEGNCSVQIPLTAADRTRLIAGITTAGLSAFTGNPAGVVGGIASIGANIERSGSFSGNAGAMNVKKPFVVITRAINAQASHYNTLYGYPLNKYGYLRNFRGYTRVQSVHVDIPNATEKEKAMIESMLRNGIKI